MEIILTYGPQTGFEEVIENKTVFCFNYWLGQLLMREYPDNYKESIRYIGRDEKKRIELAIPVHVFERIKSDPVFVMHADTLRRVRTSGRFTILEFLIYPAIKPFDNDLDIE